MKSNADNFVVFKLEHDFFAIPVSIAYEVIEYQEPTEVPDMDSFIKGIVNVRGNILPIIDLRLKFDFKEKSPTIETVIIILDLDIDNKNYNIGIIVDKVISVLEIKNNQILSIPDVGSKYKPYFVKGLCKMNSEYVAILNLVTIFTNNEITKIIGGVKKR